MDGYTKKEYVRFEKEKDDDEDDDDEWDSSRTKVKYTLLKEEEFED